MERQRFEDSWKESFQNAEVNPPDSLWTNIELDLEKENGSKMKRRIMFFQLLAAASIAFAMTFAGIGVYFVMNNNDNQSQFATDLNRTRSTTPESSAQTRSEAKGNATADHTAAAGANHATAGANTASVQQPSAQVAATDKDQTAAYGPGRPSAPADALAKTDRTAAAPEQSAASAAHTAVATADAKTQTSNRIASTSGNTTATSRHAAESANAASHASGRKTTDDQNASASNHVASTTDHATPSSNHASAVSSDPAAPASSRVASNRTASGATSTGQAYTAANRIASAVDQTASGSSDVNRAAYGTTSAGQANAASNRISSAGDQTASGSSEVNRVASGTTSEDQTTAMSNRIASAGDQTVPRSSEINRVASGATSADQATATSNRIASAGDQTVPASNRMASTSGQATPASQRTATDPAVQSQVAANPFTSLVTALPEERELSTTQGPLPPITRTTVPSSIAPAAPSSEADPVALMLARLNDQEKQYTKEEKEKKKKDKGTERLWTSVGVAAGAYNMVTSGGGSTTVAASNFDQAMARTSSSDLTQDVVHQQSSASGMAYSVGLNLGTKLATRWVLQGGVNYLTQSSGYTTNAAVSTSDNSLQFAVASIESLNKASTSGRQDSKVIPTASYRVNSSLQYFSVPLQAGYLIVNRTFGLQFNAGVSTDLFVKNTLTPDGGSLEKSTQTRSDDNTPYRPLNFSGLVGTELSYRFGPHYRLALNPGVRYPFSSIYKSDIAVSAMPLTFDVGLKFRYIFH